MIAAQLLATAAIAAFSLILSGTATAISAVAGGLASALPNSYFAHHAFRYRGARNADRVLRSFMRGEFGKITLTLMMFALSFTLITNLQAPALILGFITIHFIGVMATGLIDFTPQAGRS